MLVGLGLVEQRHKAVLEVLARGDGHRRGPPLWRDPPDGAPLAEELCPLRARRSCRSLLPAGQLPPSDAT